MVHLNAVETRSGAAVTFASSANNVSSNGNGNRLQAATRVRLIGIALLIDVLRGRKQFAVVVVVVVLLCNSRQKES